MSSTPIIPARFAGTCPLCVERWTAGTPIAPFRDTGEHAGRWGHPGCVTADGMGLPSVDAVKDRIAAIRAELDAGDLIRKEERP